MKIERTGFFNSQLQEGIIYQNNFPTLGEILFSHFTSDYKDENEFYSKDASTVAKFIIKQSNKNPL